MAAGAQAGARGWEAAALPAAESTRPAAPPTVLSVAFPLAPVGPDAVGGAEQVLSRLDAALVRAGHHSVVVACAGSSAAGTLVATAEPTGTITDAVRRRAYAAHRRAIARALSRW